MSEITPSLFRFLVVASIVVAAIGALFDYFLVPVPEENELSKMPIWALVAYVAAGAAALIGALVALFGLYNFRRWARWLMLWCSGIILLMAIPLGGYESHSIPDTFFTVSAMLHGAILALAYWSPISDHFKES